ncbi:hypothetical protein vBPaerPsIn_197c [Pseudomonas phage vB_Paer_PsIn]|uniref:Uncharacterized protein n=3 Tax=Pakpunavirus TaxID=1921407 RepID=A0AAE9GUZ7_9CAUD|nr:hypothetical protein QE347_gp184 [Pseudomonas phage vB_Paer_Ps12]YP_010765493.1 hypothetical protein QE348_gp192 [Pseudomonas phage vB_Paer_PsIn]YP_010765690.1 hypothetical protein QE349_gp195 [Pseudomonas phage vB_Paer_PsCh]UOL47831.1 hypothetical protein vBPaerPs25_187c [Pseudomonas phage vB_Paer_Ps25]UOL47644.1 hypothetical protein vBPaerPs12_188c [Pseudomonas phage vB_Paer_Ps12]UOL48028.1 hypothetical protein vBPaerPsCh_197c [Pseudomonas phage vB_Paer_PsCh]UOL48225.1 hypothetical prote
MRRERRRKPFSTGEEERVSCCGIEPPIALLREPAILALLAYDPESLKASTRYTIARHWLEAGTRTPTIGSQPKGSIRATQSPHE